MATQETAIGRRRAGASYFWHPALILLFLIGSHIGVSVLAQRHLPSGAVHGDITLGILLILIATIVLLAIEVIGLSIALFRRSSIRALGQALAIVLLVGSVAFGRYIAISVQYVNLFLYPHIFEACMQSAEPYRTDAKFNLCNGQSLGNSFSLIVYDTGGEIASPAAHQSPAFKALLNAQKSPLLSQCKVAPARRLYQAFYFVDVDCDSRPDG